MCSIGLSVGRIPFLNDVLKEQSISDLDSAEEGWAGDLLVVKEDLNLMGDGLLGGEGD
jgi:hypothetical protein